jgi:hypothetical protein
MDLKMLKLVIGFCCCHLQLGSKWTQLLLIDLHIVALINKNDSLESCKQTCFNFWFCVLFERSTKSVTWRWDKILIGLIEDGEHVVCWSVLFFKNYSFWTFSETINMYQKQCAKVAKGLIVVMLLMPYNSTFMCIFLYFIKKKQASLTKSFNRHLW